MSRSCVNSLVFVSAVAAAALVMASPALAGTPALSVKPGSSAACGGAGAICVPGNDVFNIPNVDVPVVIDTIAKLGLQAGDNITSLSCRSAYAADSRIIFSVTSTSTGVAGTAPDVFSEAAAGEVGADLFDGGLWQAPAANRLVVDDDGTISNPAGSFAGLGLAETDDIDAVTGCDLSDADTENVYFTLGTGSPSLALDPTASAAAVFVKAIGSPGPPTLAFQAAHFGLTNVDVFDGFIYAVSEHKAVYSLAPGSPSLATIDGTGALPGDILQGFGTPHIFIPGSTLGLAPGDDIDGLALFKDADLDLCVDSRDNCPGLANNDQFDTDNDNTGDACEDSDLDGHFDRVDNCPAYPNPAQDDADADDEGDDCDPCTNVTGAHDAVSAKASLAKIGTDVVVGNDSLTISARFVIDSAFESLEPDNRGAIVIVRDHDGNDIVHATLPYNGETVGADWTGKPGKFWKFKDASGTPVSGITAVKITNLSKKLAGLVQMNVTARKASFSVDSADDPLEVILVAGDQSVSSEVGDCGEANFASEGCKFNGAGNKLSCKLP